MIRHGQFLQDIEVIELMYQSLFEIERDGIPKSRQWLATMASGPLGQIQETRAEMHDYLRLPASLPDPAPSPDTDPAPQVVTEDDFRLGLKTLGRLYRGLGELRCAICDCRPGLYTACSARIAPQIKVYQDALELYIGWRKFEETLNAMERKFACDPVNGSSHVAELTPTVAESPP